ncbi:transporter substrate-binding domain-containing protein [Bdellovibrio bacteriovorus]|uniref:Uncharacterized protein n=1 Tax=Bdellovibrio bacteriovorus str. Tiberius TaxID=1069642 RepID=K7YZ55_BDEBC|nr:transporter substrate-binding domain-containing protein [Bdellovibrio bacteriovorus]AFY03023.1 hypothetical protein Bdt_3348 [Bdellovibrio bacteriovorus str. Tiberius]
MKLLVLMILLVGSISAAAQTAELKPMVMGLPFQVKRVKAILQYQDFVNTTLVDAGYKVTVHTSKGRLTSQMLVGGELDAVTYDDKTWTEGRDKTVSVSFPIIRTRARIFYLADNQKFNEAKLKKFKGGFSTNNIALNKEAERRKLKYINTVSPLQSVVDLLAGKIDYFVAIQEVGLSVIESHPEAKGKVVMGKLVFLEVPLYMTFAKRFDPDMPKIEAAFKKALTGDLSKYPLIMENLNKEP